MILLLVSALIAVFLYQPLSSPAQGEGTVFKGQLKLEKPIFWQTEETEVTGFGAGLSALCDESQGRPCFDFTVDVVDPAARLRVALNNINGDHDSDYVLQLFAPGGTEPVAEQGTYNTEIQQHFLSAEVFATNPTLGMWRIRVVLGCNMFSRRCKEASLRANLERAPVREEPRPLLPDLRVEPPFNVGFGSCRPGEESEGACLRFAFGPANVGDGPLAFNFSAWDPVTLTGDIWQRVYRSDDTPYTYDDNDRNGAYSDSKIDGQYEYHAEHHHFHIAAYSEQKLFKVIDPVDGKIEQVGKGRVIGHGLSDAGEGEKTGFCLMDTGLTRWTEFFQDPRTWAGGECRTSSNNPTSPRMGLSKGWTDIYYQHTPGNFVDFGSNGDGFYVVQVQMDPENRFREIGETGNQIRETDSYNYGYAYIKVEGQAVTLLERGQGMHPWDSRKIVCPLLHVGC